jgi:transglutaminase-like putative cysteine protease
MSGWALFFELEAQNNAEPMLLAMAYGPAERQELQLLHFSALDSLAPTGAARLNPGPIMEYAYPRERRVRAEVFGLGVEAWIFEEDAEAAQALVDREFDVLRRYENAPNWREAWIRFYRMIYRDSFERLIDIAFQVERKLNVPSRENRDLAEQILFWVQSFEYERNFEGSDFVNAVSAATEGRGDCDSRAMLWAAVLRQAGIPSGIMVSRNYSHAMGLAELDGAGARFEVDGQRLLVAETTARVGIGLIGETVSDIEYWLGILFE